jgi:hypothetical protein
MKRVLVVPLLDFMPGIEERNRDEDDNGFPAMTDLDL